MGGVGHGTQGHGRGRGCGRGHGQGHRAHGGKAEDKEKIPVTKLGRLVKDMKLKSLEEIYLFSLPIRESEIIDSFPGASLQDEVLKTIPVQNTPVLASGPGSRRLLSLETTMDTSVWVVSAPRRWPLPSVGP